MLKVRDIGAHSDEKRILDGHVIIVEWQYKGKPTFMYWEASESNKSSLQIGFYQNGLIKSVEILLAENVLPLQENDYMISSSQVDIRDGLPIFQQKGKLGKVFKSKQPFHLLIGADAIVIDLEYGLNSSYKYFIKSGNSHFGINQNDDLSLIRIDSLSADEIKMVQWKYGN